MRARVSRVRSGLTYANVVATLALVLILGSGTAVAHHLVVDSSDVVDGSLAGIDVRDSTLRGADLANQAVSSAKLADNAILQRHLAPAEALDGGHDLHLPGALQRRSDRRATPRATSRTRAEWSVSRAP